MNFPKQASVNEPSMIQALATAMNERGVVPEWELFDLGMVDYAHFLVQRGILNRPYYANIILGSLGTLSATPYNLAAMVRALPEGTVWSGAGIGRFQFYVNSMAITMGGHIRVGLEDNLFFDPLERTQPATNAGKILMQMLSFVPILFTLQWPREGDKLNGGRSKGTRRWKE
jgi:uncharacterized protein (DUF849 family)